MFFIAKAAGAKKITSPKDCIKIPLLDDIDGQGRKINMPLIERAIRFRLRQKLLDASGT